MSYYDESVDVVLKKLKSSSKGLTKNEVKKRLEKYGFNSLGDEDKINYIKLFLEQFNSFIIYILLFAVFLTLILGHYKDAIIIIVILIINAIIGFYQELSATKSIVSLKKLEVKKAKVFRDGVLEEIDAKYLVPGDIIYVEAGDKVPADARIIESSNLEVIESALTGESLAVLKQKEKLNKSNLSIGDQKNILFSSTDVISGTARAVVFATGKSTQIGKISKLLTDTKKVQTPLQKKLDDFGRKLGVLVILICIFIFFVLIMTKGFSIDNLVSFGLIAISLAVAAVPTALPVVVTISLSIGVKRLYKKHTLVRKLASVETLGSCSVITTDKTGTLTKNEMVVVKVYDCNNEADVSGIGYNPQGKISKPINSLLYKIGMIANNASHFKEDGIWQITGDSTEASLLVLGKKAKVDIKNIERISELPFDSKRKLMSVFVLDDKKYFVYTKGAPDELLKRCNRVIIDGRVKKLTPSLKKEIIEKNKQWSSSALRVLGFAYKPVREKKEFNENDLIFVGLVGMKDPLREDVIEAIAKTKQAGIDVIMITGDYSLTARAIANELGIYKGLLEGYKIDQMSDDELKEKLKEGVNVFARVSPENKIRIVSALQDLGEVVAMIGDGVNDAPAIKKADVGVAVNNATDLAKEAADFILLKNSFSNIVDAIEEGRGIYDNIQKSIILLLSGNVGEVLIIFLAVLIGFNLPLSAILLLWINLITDSFPALAYAVDPYDKNIMKRKPLPKQAPILPKSKTYLLLFLGFIGSLISLVLFSVFGGNSQDVEKIIYAQTIVFTFVVLYELILTLLIRKEYGVKLFTNKFIWFSIILSLILQIILIYTPINKIFNIVPIDLFGVLSLIFASFIFYFSYLIYKKLITNSKII